MYASLLWASEAELFYGACVIFKQMLDLLIISRKATFENWAPAFYYVYQKSSHIHAPIPMARTYALYERQCKN
jgi:hypothetical protein